jgi:uncharacterized protein YcgI (DUF1989 family)
MPGALHFDEQHCRAGDYVELRFEMHTLLVLSTCPHPLDPATHYRPAPVMLRAWFTGPAPGRTPAGCAARKMPAAFATPR